MTKLTDNERGGLRKEWGEFNDGMLITTEEESNIVANYWLAKLDSLLEKRQQETSAFLHNVLKGIDIADKNLGGGGTMALRLALMSRGLLLSEPKFADTIKATH